MAMPDSVKICEMAPRDGLQYVGGNESRRYIPLERRVQLIHDMVAAGVRRIEVGAVVAPKGTAQMAMADELGRDLRAKVVVGIEQAPLVPHEAGYERFK